MRDSGSCYYASQVTYPTDDFDEYVREVWFAEEREVRGESTFPELMVCFTVFSTYRRRAVSNGGHTSNMRNSWHTRVTGRARTPVH